MGVNIIRFRKDLGVAKNSLNNIARNAALAKFNPIKDAMIQAFEDHKVTLELDEGPSASENLSGTLSGKGNLFSFLGFEEGEEPTAVVREALHAVVQLDTKATIDDRGNRWVFKFLVSSPTLQTLHSLTPLTNWGTKSWIQAIEKGVSGFEHYIYWKTFDSDPPSRSGTGTQAKNVLRGGNFQPRVYISKILKDFEERLK